jgi:hypothetical protein
VALLAAALALEVLPAEAKSSVHHRPINHPVTHNAHRHHAKSPQANARAQAAIIGGSPAAGNTFRSLAYILDVRGHQAGQCTGTVVAPRLVLTAGHCAENHETGIVNEPSGYAVVTGNVNWTASPRQVTGISQVIVYPFYENSGLLEGWGDAALLVLSQATTAPAIPVASDAESGLWQPGTHALIAGWGRTYYGQAGPTELLQWAPTILQNAEWCHSNAPGFHAYGQVCTIDPPRYETGGCEGDSGGPLLASRPGGGELVEVGILVVLYSKCSTAAPTVYTRAALVSSWVNSWIKVLELPPAPAAPVALAPSSAPAGAQTRAPLRAPPNRPGLYITRKSRDRRIATRVSGDGEHLVQIDVRAKIRCERGYSYQLDGSWLSYADSLLIKGHVARATLNTPGNRSMRAGHLSVYMRFAGSRIVEGHMRLYLPSRSRRIGPCYARAINFTATRSG